MRKFLSFFAGIMVMFIVLVSINICLRLYNSIKSQKINIALMQPSELWQNRIETPVPLSDMSDDYIKNQLITKFVTEYLRVIPNSAELSWRSNQTLRYMSSSNVLEKWENSVKPELSKMASDKKMRNVYVDPSKISIQGDYYIVPFTTITWNEPNNFKALPVSDNSQEMYLKIQFNKKVRGKMFGRDPSYALDNGIPPFAIFEFVVNEVIIQ